MGDDAKLKFEKASTLVLAVAGAGCVVLVSTHPVTHVLVPLS
jgi:hypothetical protein